MAMACTTGTMALHGAAVARNSFCPSSSLAPLRPGPANFGNTSSAEGLSFGSREEARGVCFKRFAKFQQFSKDGADEILVDDGGKEMEEDSADQYVHSLL